VPQAPNGKSEAPGASRATRRLTTAIAGAAGNDFTGDAPVGINNARFLQTIFGKSEARRAWVAGFAESPDQLSGNRELSRRCWAGALAGNRQRGHAFWKKPKGKPLDLNTFYCISLFRANDKGEVRRRKALHEATYVIMIDDVGHPDTPGVKVSWAELETKLGGFEASYAIETSPGNWQVGLMLKEPETRRWALEQLVDGMIAQGLALDGTDPGMKGVTRYARLPVGYNNKAKHVERNNGQPWRHRLKFWRPESRYTVEELAALFDITLREPATRTAPRASVPDEWPDDPVLAVLHDEGLVQGRVDPRGNGWHITCPWVEEHTGGLDDGAAYFRRGSVDDGGRAHPDGGFSCHHGHCEARTVRDLWQWLEDKGHSVRRSAEEAFAHIDLGADGHRDHDVVEEDLDSFPHGHPREQAERYMKARCHRGGELLLRHHRDQFFRHNGICYESVEPAALNDGIGAWAERFRSRPKPTKANPEPEPVGVQVNQRLISEIRTALAGKTLIPERTEQPAWLAPLEGNEPPAVECIPCANGILHAPTRRLLKSTPRFWSVNALEYGFDRSATCLEFEAFVRSIFEDDKDGTSILTLQEMFGYLVSQDTSQQKLFFIQGPRRSGKGTLARVLFDLIGKHNCAAPTLDSLVERFGLSQLIGKQLAVISDAQFGGGKDQVRITEQLKRISGEDPVTADRKNISAWTGRLSTRFLIMSNSLPLLNDPSGALAGRLVPLVLTKSFYGEEDLGLYDRLKNELPGILNWSLAGYARLRSQGHFTEPTKSKSARDRIHDITSPVSAFARDHLEFGDEFEAPVADVYQEWRRYCERNGRRYPSSANHFSADLTAAFPQVESRRVRRQGNRGYYFCGVRLRVPASPEPPFDDLLFDDLDGNGS